MIKRSYAHFLVLCVLTLLSACYLPDIEETTEEKDPRYIVNGGFETGDLTGWKIVSGTAFDNTSISTATTWWAEAISFNKEGSCHLDGWGGGGESAVGVLRSSIFSLSGSGWITFKLGGMKNTSLCYISVYEAGSDTEIARFGNTAFADVNFPDPEAGMRLANMEQYKADLSEWIGKNLYLEIVDNAENDWGVVFADAFVTYHETTPASGTQAVNMINVMNGGFETGDFTGWTSTGDAFTADGLITDTTWWAEEIPYNKDGSYHFCSWSTAGGEAAKGTLTSSTFTLSGSGWISYKLGGMANSSEMYLSVIDSETETELARFGNSAFADIHFPNPDEGMRLANMELYKANLTDHIRKKIKLVIVDNASAGWGIVVCDSFRAVHKTEPTEGVLAVNILP